MSNNERLDDKKEDYRICSVLRDFWAATDLDLNPTTARPRGVSFKRFVAQTYDDPFNRWFRFS